MDYKDKQLRLGIGTVYVASGEKGFIKLCVIFQKNNWKIVDYKDNRVWF